MWEAVQLPRETDAPEETERLIQQFAEEKMQEYDGNVFFCISRRDQERRLTLPGRSASFWALKAVHIALPSRALSLQAWAACRRVRRRS